jgi:FSR family fosmidomycin resistance protein-like MFS transporter
MQPSAGALAPPSRLERLVSGYSLLALLSLGHTFIDLYSGALGVLQPFLIRKLELSLTQAGILGGALILSSSVAQPLYGYLSDRFRSPLFTTLAPAVAGLCICSLAWAPAYGYALLCVILGGAGVAAFHPQGSSWAAAGVRRNRGGSMAVFISAGTLGMAMAPIFFERWIAAFGFARLPWAAAMGVAVSLLLFFTVREPAGLMTKQTHFDAKLLMAQWKPLAILYVGVFLRSAIQVVYAQYLVLYLSRERGFSVREAAYGATAYLTAGALGGFLGGHLSDRFGAKRVILWSFAGSMPFLGAFFLVANPLPSILLLAAGGFILLFTIPVNVVVAQKLVPTQAGTVSALLMGFAWGGAGLVFLPLVGWAAEHVGLHAVMFSLVGLSLPAWLLTRRLPEGIGS